MNDNEPFAYHEDICPPDVEAAQNAQMAKSRPLAERAIAAPETLTIHDIHNLGWGLSVALKRLMQHEADVTGTEG